MLKTEYKYGQYCTSLTQSDLWIFFRVSDNPTRVSHPVALVTPKQESLFTSV